MSKRIAARSKVKRKREASRAAAAAPTRAERSQGRSSGTSATRWECGVSFVEVAQAGAVGVAARAVGAEKALEHARQITGVDADAGVGDGDGAAAVGDVNIEPHCAARRRELDRIVEQDEEQAAHQDGVAGDRGFLE